MPSSSPNVNSFWVLVVIHVFVYTYICGCLVSRKRVLKTPLTMMICMSQWIWSWLTSVVIVSILGFNFSQSFIFAACFHDLLKDWICFGGMNRWWILHYYLFILPATTVIRRMGTQVPSFTSAGNSVLKICTVPLNRSANGHANSDISPILICDLVIWRLDPC
jgi:hypothetical protein